MEILDVDMKHIDNEIIFCLFVDYQESKKIFNIVIWLLLHPMCLVKFLLEILCVNLKFVFFFGHSITNNWHLNH